MSPLPPVTMYFMSEVGPSNFPERTFSNVLAMRVDIVRESLSHHPASDDASNGICRAAWARYFSSAVPLPRLGSRLISQGSSAGPAHRDSGVNDGVADNCCHWNAGTRGAKVVQKFE